MRLRGQQSTRLSSLGISCLISLLCLTSGPNLSLADSPSCLKREDIERTPEGWWEKVGGAIFKVYVMKKGAPVPRGTATLIDKQGYFVTASHIFEYAEDNLRFPSPIEDELLLVNHNQTLKLKAREVIHRSSPSAADISLIKAEMTVEIADQVSAVDPLFDFPRRPWQYILLGYKEKLSEPEFHTFFPAQPTSLQKEYIRGKGDSPYYGESGSLGINQAGQGVAILEGYDKRGFEFDYNLFKLTPLARGQSIVPAIEASALVKRMLDNLRKNDVNYVTNALRNSIISTIELYTFTNDVIKNIASYRNLFLSSTELRRTLREKLLCKNLDGLEEASTVAIYNASVPKEVKFEGGSIALDIYKTLAANGIQKEARRTAFERAIDYFKKADDPNEIGQAPGFSFLIGSRENYAQYQAEFAYALNEGLQHYPDLGITKESIDRRVKSALRWDNKNQLAYEIAATGDKDIGYYRPALDRAIAELPGTDARASNLRFLRDRAFTGAVQ